MSAAPTQVAVPPSTVSIVTTTQMQKDYLEEPISRQNSIGNRHRGGSKGKHLTRSHAMRESTSPPRTPTPRSSELLTPTSPSGLSSSSPETVVDSRLNFQQTSSTTSSPLLETPSMILHQNSNTNYHNPQSQSPPQIFSIDGGGNQSQLDLDFPKLTPPKSKSPRANNNNSNSNITNNYNNNNSDKISPPSSNNNTLHKNEQHGFNSGTDCNKQILNSQNNNSNIMLNNSPSLTAPANTNNLSTVNNNHVNDSSLLQVINSSTSSSQSSTNNTHMQYNNNSSSSVPPQQIQQQNSYDKIENRSSRDNIINSPGQSPNINHMNNGNINYYQNEDSYHRVESPSEYINRGGPGNGGNINNKKHRVGATAKSSKPRLKTMGSSSSMEGGNNSSGFISRDSSTEQFTDQSGVDLLYFFKETLNKNAKDRNMLMRIEKELLTLALDRTRTNMKFPAMSSYNRMLIHRVAAYFGMEHNVDATQQSVIAAITKSTRVPEIRFKSLIRETFSDEPRKSILKRDAHSFDECRQFLGPDRGVLDRKAKSFEEREEEYEKGEFIEDHPWPWSSSDSSENNQSARLKIQNNRLLKVQSVETRNLDVRPSVSKSHSFGGYGGGQSNASLLRGDSITSTKSAGGRLFTKQDSTGSTNTPWRLSPSSSGYKTQSIRSESVTPSPTGYGSGDHTPELSAMQSPATTCGVVWAVTDMASVPVGSVLIDPQTLQPIVNQDGTIYHFDPSNLPPKSMTAKSLTHSRQNSSNNSQTNNNSSSNRMFEKQKSIKNENDVNDLTNDKTNIVQNVIEENIETITVITDLESQIETKENDEMSSPGSNDENETINEHANISNNCSNNSLDLDSFQSQSELQIKPHKSQATSPNLPQNVTEFHPTQHNEITTSQELTTIVDHTSTTDCINDTNSLQQNNLNNSSNNNNNSNISNNCSGSNSSSHITSYNDHKKDEYKQPVTQSTIAVMSYSTGYSSMDNGTVFAGGPNTTFPAYQQGVDGSVYAVPQPMMYAYPQPIDQEVPAYFVPFYDQGTGQQRDATTALITQPTTTAIYPQPGAGTTAVVPLATYSQPLYQGQVVYAQEQFASNPNTSQIPQYPITYPVGYPYTYNGATYQGYWGQPMTYYVPQSQLTTAPNPVSTSLIAPPQAISTTANMQSNTSNVNNSNNHHNSKRGSPPQPNQTTQYTTHSALPIPITDPTSGTTTMYAIPPLYPGMLPYTSPPAGVLSHQLQTQPNTVINSVIPPQIPPPPTLSQSQQLESQAYHQMNATGSGTPQSTPSTPLSLPLPLPHHPKNQSIFATPPILQNGYATAQQISGCNLNFQNGTEYSYDRKNINNASNPTRRTTYINSTPNRPSSNQNSNTTNNGYYQTQSYNQVTMPRKTYDSTNNRSNTTVITQKRNDSYRQQQHTASPSGIIPINQANSITHTSYDKIRGPRSKPPNLDLRRNNNNNSNRNTPSTNSNESNNSPNSISSNNDHQTIYMTASRGSTANSITGAHLQHLHSQAAAAHHLDPCHQQLISAYNPMYVKFGQYFTHPSVALSSNRRSPPNEIRPPLASITGMYPMNVMLSAQRQFAPRPTNPNYKGNKPR